MENIDISQIMIVINTVAILGGMIGFGKKVIIPLKKLYDMDIMLKEHDDKIKCLEKKIQKIVDAEKMICKSQANILNHLVDGNSKDKLKETRDEILDFSSTL